MDVTVGKGVGVDVDVKVGVTVNVGVASGVPTAQETRNNKRIK